MIYEMRTYTLHPGKVPEFEALIECEALPHLTKHAKLVGWWSTEIGPLNEIVHLWAYEDMGHRERSRKQQASDPTLAAFRPKAQRLVLRQENKILVPSNFSPLQ